MIYIKNITSSPLNLSDLGWVIDANAELELTESFSRYQLLRSNKLIENISNGNLTVRNDFENLSITRAIKLIIGEIEPTEIDKNGKWKIRTDSRPTGTTTVFTGRGDDIINNIVGQGKKFNFDFINTDDLISAPEGFKRKQIDFNFIHNVFLKEGSLYFFNMPKGSYIDMYNVCPAGGYYIKKTLVGNQFQEEVALATEDTIIAHWINHNFMEGSCPMGDELNTEAAVEEAIPPYIIWRVEITIPEVENYQDAHGYFHLEIYRHISV